MSLHTSFGVGGPAPLFIEPHNLKYLSDLLKFLFIYSGSDLGENGKIIVKAGLKLKPERHELVKSNVSEVVRERKKRFPSPQGTAGSIFKNPLKEPAGRLIEACGLKGTTKGGAIISEKHGNFIQCKKGANATDVIYLISLIEKTVKKQFGVDLSRR